MFYLRKLLYRIIAVLHIIEKAVAISFITLQFRHNPSFIRIIYYSNIILKFLRGIFTRSISTGRIAIFLQLLFLQHLSYVTRSRYSSCEM